MGGRARTPIKSPKNRLILDRGHTLQQFFLRIHADELVRIDEENDISSELERARHRHVDRLFLMPAGEVAKNVNPVGALGAGGAHNLAGPIGRTLIENNHDIEQRIEMAQEWSDYVCLVADHRDRSYLHRSKSRLIAVASRRELWTTV
jgi:hypothetical protein